MPRIAADHRGDDALVAHHPPRLAAAQPDRAEHTDLARALEDREDERVDDAEQRDDHAHRQQRVEQVDDLVEVVELRLHELVAGLDLDDRIGLLEARPTRFCDRSGLFRSGLAEHDVRVALGRDRLEARRRHDEPGQVELSLVVDPSQGVGGLAARARLERERAPDVEVVTLGEARSTTRSRPPRLA